MKRELALVICGILVSHILLGQGNYVANTSNSATPGTFNTLVGPVEPGNGSLTGDRNTAVGYYAGLFLSTGKANSLFGVDAGRGITSGWWNTMIGSEGGLNMGPPA